MEPGYLIVAGKDAIFSVKRTSYEISMFALRHDTIPVFRVDHIHPQKRIPEKFFTGMTQYFFYLWAGIDRGIQRLVSHSGDICDWGNVFQNGAVKLFALLQGCNRPL